MSAYNIPGRSKGAAQVVSHAAKTVHDTNTLLSPLQSLPTCVELYINCTVAGNVALKMWGGSSVVYAVPVGSLLLSGMFSHIMSTSTTATATYVARFATT